MDFVNRHAPKNLRFVISRSSDMFESEEDFFIKLDAEIKKFTPANKIKLTPEQKACAELNYRPCEGEKLGKLWREENRRVHDAYGEVSDVLFMERVRADSKIFAIAYHKGFDDGINVGSTKNSIVKHWVAVGALKPTEGGFVTTILSPSQLENTKFEFRPISIKGLEGKNFDRIRVLVLEK